MAIQNCKECKAQVSDKAETCPACGAPVKKKTGVLRLIMYGIGGFFALAIVAGIAGGKGKSGSSSQSSGQSNVGAPAAAAPAFQDADLKSVLASYKENELKGDSLFKGKTIRLTGKVDDVKNDILNHPFVTLGTGAQFEIPQIQCSLADTEASKAASLSKGQSITVVGEVKGLMMNVQMDECVIQ